MASTDDKDGRCSGGNDNGSCSPLDVFSDSFLGDDKEVLSDAAAAAVGSSNSNLWSDNSLENPDAAGTSLFQSAIVPLLQKNKAFVPRALDTNGEENPILSPYDDHLPMEDESESKHAETTQLGVFEQVIDSPKSPTTNDVVMKDEQSPSVLLNIHSVTMKMIIKSLNP